LPNLEAARESATQSIRSIISDEARLGRIDLQGRVEITTGGEDRVMVVPFADAIELILGPPSGSGEQAGILT